MRTLCLIAVFATFGMFPFSVRADVIINEIAWMGTDEGGANCEWVELRNMSDEIVDLSAWTLTIENAGNATPKVIALNETASVKYSGISANGYYLIARDSGTCKDLVPATSADWLGSFGNGISNSGAKLILKNGTTEEDAVDSKTGWEVTKGGMGGKNTAPKETPQKDSASWIVASPTPRGPNHAAPLEELPEEEENTTPPVVTVGGTAPLVPVTHPVAKLFVDGGPSRIVTAGADTAFTAVAYDSVGTLRKNADITWAFGDGGREKGEDVFYAYKKPGTYTAVVRAKDKGVSAVSLIQVSVVAPEVAISSVEDDGITLTNATNHLLDLSGWKLSAGTKNIQLPSDTVIAGGSSAFFSYETLHIASSSDVALKFPNGRIAHSFAKPEVGKDELYEMQETLPARPLAVAEAPIYAKEAVSAPVKQAEPALAGAAPSAGTVVLKEDTGFLGGMGSLVASVFSSVVGVFSR
jgi:hypothetical protein